MLGWLLLFILLSYAVPHLLVSLLPTQDLKKKYGASWALVTGASSGALLASPPPAVLRPLSTGIGRSLAQKLAAQGLNVVMVALEVRAGWGVLRRL